MTNEPNFDLDAADQYFSAACFNAAWELLDRPSRSAEEDERMIRLALSSHWHWSQREDCEPTNVSIAHWQTSRIYAVLGQAQNARRYAQLCLAVSQVGDVAPLYVGYAYEALARAEMVGGNHEKMEQYLGEALRIVDTVPDPEAKRWLLDDLSSLT